VADSVKIETRVVAIPNVGTFFRRAWKAPDGTTPRVEYLEVVYGEIQVVAEPQQDPVTTLAVG
jgi:hypothetical protein